MTHRTASGCLTMELDIAPEMVGRNEQNVLYNDTLNKFNLEL